MKITGKCPECHSPSVIRVGYREICKGEPAVMCRNCFWKGPHSAATEKFTKNTTKK